VRRSAQLAADLRTPAGFMLTRLNPLTSVTIFQSQAWSGDWQGTLPIQEPMSQVRGNSLAKFRGGGADNPHYKARMPSAQVEMFSKSSHFQGQSDNALFCFKMLVRSCVREDEVVSEF
jgi:hypothetical protein